MKCKSRTSLWLLVLALFISVKTSGQEPYLPTKVIPPSPTAASLGVYGDMPVGYYTGTPQIEISLFDIKTSHHSLPIKLNYNATGIRVSQDAGWVGLGWSLLAGGVISRTIRGEDDLSAEGYVFGPPLPPNDEDNNFYRDPAYGENDPYYTNSKWYFWDIVKKQKDGEPDVFFYNFGKYSGKFLMGKSVNADMVFAAERNNLDIKFDRNYNSGSYAFSTGQWIVKTPDGYQYYFRAPEVTENYYKNSEITNFSGLEPNFIRSYKEIVSSWYLSLIKAPSGEEISFTYDIGMSLSLINTFQKRYDRTSFPQGNASLMSSVFNYFNASRQVIHEVLLKKIEFTNGYMLFNRSDRDDIEPVPLYSIKPAKLSDIEIYNSANELIKRIAFQYSYFNNNMSSSYNYTYKRLKLDAITQYGKNNVPENPYLFEYYAPNELPGKYSKQIDDWGFYSSFYSPRLPGEFHPSLLPKVQTQTSTGLTTFDGTDREADKTGNFIKRGILTSITYPTKGKTIFDYEVNDYRITPFTITQPITLANAYFNYNHFEGKLIENFDLSTTLSVTFTLDGWPQWEDTIPATQNVAYLKNRNNNAIIQSFSMSNSPQTITLPAGQYYIQVDEVFDYYNSLTASYESSPITITSKKGGGLRIKTIVNYDYDGNKLKTKKFVYTENGSVTGVSTGQLLSSPLKHYKKVVTIYEDPQYPLMDTRGMAEYLVRASSTMHPPGLYSAPSSVCYDKVWVLEGENGEGGSTQYAYYNSATANTQYPEMPVPFYSLNGKTKFIEVRDANGKRKSNTFYNYELKETFTLKGVKILKPYPDASPSFLYDEGDVRYYDNVSEWWVLASQTESRYFEDKVLVTTKTYTYSNPIHKQITQQELKGSDGITLTTTYKYPHDFVTQQPYNNMVNAYHIISPVIEQSAFKGGTLLETTRTNYHDWGNNLVAPVTVESKQGAEPYDTRVRYHGYDNKGNVVSASKQDDVITSYIWGYNKSLPIIKAENANVTDLNLKTGQALIEMGYSSGLNDLDNFLTSLGRLTTSSQKQALKTFADKLRQKFVADKVFPVVYAYYPLIGVTGMIDANNRAVYYEYDPFGRLQVIRDDEGNIVQSYQYNYRQ